MSTRGQQQRWCWPRGSLPQQTWYPKVFTPRGVEANISADVGLEALCPDKQSIRGYLPREESRPTSALMLASRLPAPTVMVSEGIYPVRSQGQHQRWCWPRLSLPQKSISIRGGPLCLQNSLHMARSEHRTPQCGVSEGPKPLPLHHKQLNPGPPTRYHTTSRMSSIYSYSYTWMSNNSYIYIYILNHIIYKLHNIFLFRIFLWNDTSLTNGW